MTCAKPGDARHNRRVFQQKEEMEMEKPQQSTEGYVQYVV